MENIPAASLGALGAALIAALISLIGLIISKENKISEFRQSWIDSLRNEISLVITHAGTIFAAGFVFNNSEETSMKEIWVGMRDDFYAMSKSISLIRLRLNPKEKNSQNVLATLRKIDELISMKDIDKEKFDYKILNEKLLLIESELILNSGVLLKYEWNRVRNGEIAFRISKISVIFSFLLIIGLLIFSIFVKN